MPLRHWILNARGEVEEEPDLLKWAAWFERAGRDGSRILAHDRDEGPGAPTILVSTVFLGIDHSFTSDPDHPDHVPILWETMILGGLLDGYQMRYATREEARAGHAEACRRMAETRPPEPRGD